MCIMETIPNNALLKYNSDTLEHLRQQFGFDTPARMTEAIQILEEWLKKQEHFVKKAFPKEYLERILIHNKGSVEKSKRKLDKICTLRTLLPDLFEERDINELSLSSEDALMDYLVPTMTPDHCRIYMLKGKEIESNPHKLSQYLKLHLVICEYLQLYDYSNGLIYIADFRNSHPVAYAKSMSIADFKKILDIGTEGYSMRIKAIHLLTDSPAISIFAAFLKQGFNAKIGSRIYIHTTLDSLYEHIPKSVLPIEYGGNESPINELRENLLKALNSAEFQEHRRVINSARTNEAFRQKDKFYDQYMGMAGTFRNLNVD